MEMIGYIYLYPSTFSLITIFSTQMSNSNFTRSVQTPENDFSDQPNFDEYLMFGHWLDEDQDYVASGSTQNSVNDDSGGSSSQFGGSSYSKHI